MSAVLVEIGPPGFGSFVSGLCIRVGQVKREIIPKATNASQLQLKAVRITAAYVVGDVNIFFIGYYAVCMFVGGYISIKMCYGGFVLC